MHSEGVSRDHPVIVTFHHSDEAIGCWLGSNADTREVAAQQVPDERSFADTVTTRKTSKDERLTTEQHRTEPEHD